MMDVGYCTNVHSGATLDETLANLDRYSVAVRERLGWDELPIGLWLNASAAEQALGRVEEIRAFLKERRLRVFTMNAFPYGDFHADVVKHAVYRPTWAEEVRVEYTLNCARLLVALGDGGGSISTLPIAWRADADDELIVKAGENLRRVAGVLAEIYDENLDTLRHPITVDLEPEPGCVLDRAEDVVRFFDEHLPDESHRRFVGVCHDICHSAVMFEPQRRVLHQYAKAGIRVNKVQMSSSVCADGSDESIEALRAFAEDRYLHQTCVRVGLGDARFFDDLPHALAAHDAGELPRGEWRVHFHVPVHLGRVGTLGTTRDQVHHGVRAARTVPGRTLYEVETYAWGVLPEPERAADLESGIADELRFVEEEVGPRVRVPGVWRDWLELFRASNLPTVWSNVVVGMAAGAVAWGGFDWGSAGLLVFGLSFIYVAGMVYNDVFDVRRDRFERPDRPIASGRIDLWNAAFIGGILVIWGLIPLGAMSDLVGWLGFGLLAAIVLYNWLHKKVAVSLVLMGVCRVLVVLIAASAVGDGITEAAWWVASAVGVYTVLLTLAARDEEKFGTHLRLRVALCWAMIGVLPALWFGLGGGSVAAGAMGVVCAGWLGRSAVMLGRGGRSVGAGIMGLLSGFCLVDAYALALLGRPGLAAAAVGCFMLTTLGHRKVSGT